MEERRVAQNAEYLFVGLSGALERLRHAHGDCEAAAHADAAVQRVQRRRKAERIAADVARDDKVLVAGHGVEEAAVRTAGTQRGRTRDGRDADVYSLGRVAENTLAQQLRIQLVELAGQLLAGAGDTGGADLLLHEGVKLLDDVELFDLRGEFADERHRQGIGNAELQEGGILREGVLGVFIGDGGGDDADLAAVQLHAVEAGGTGVFLQRAEVFLDLGVVEIGVSGGGNEFADVSGIGRDCFFRAFAEADKALGVRNAGRDAVEHRKIEFFRDLIGVLHEVQTLL